MDQSQEFDVIVIGSGAAGLTATLAAHERLGDDARIAIVERSAPEARGGNTRWTGAYLRLEDPYTPADGFLEDAERFSQGYADLEYWTRLTELLPDTMEWLQAFGLRFKPRSTSFLTKSRPRLLPDGGGEAIVRILGERAEELGVETLFETTAEELIQGEDGTVTGVVLRDRKRGVYRVRAGAVIIASGGFQGSQRMMSQYYGNDAYKLHPIAPGGWSNKGEGITMAIDAGAASSGQWDAFHAEPKDPRSKQPAPTMMAFPYGILVNADGKRFIDEGENTVDENYEKVARAIRRQPESIAYLIADQKLNDVPGITRAINTDQPPVTGETIGALAEQLGILGSVLEDTVQSYNSSLSGGEFIPGQLDSLHTSGTAVPKSNWARPIDRSPYIAYPMACSVVFTFGGIATNLSGEVITEDGAVIPGLYAAGECTGVYYGKYFGATSVLRSLIYGRVAGEHAADRREQRTD